MKRKTRVLTLLLALTVLATLYSATCSAQTTPTELEWTLTITGLVEHPLTLTLAELAALPSITEYATIYCVDFPTTIVTTGNWTGVKLSYLLQLAGANSTAKVAFFASDGYSTDLSMQLATQDTVLVAYQQNGEPLTETLRLVVPGHWGYKWISQLTNINLVDYNYLGVWESRGYSDTASTDEPSGVVNSPGTPNQYNPPTSQPPQVSASPSPTTLPPTPSPTTPLTSIPSTSPITTPIPTNTMTTSPTILPSPSPIATKSADPSYPSADTSIVSAVPYAVAIAVFSTVVVGVSVVVFRRKPK